MKIHHTPKVILVTRPTIVQDGVNELLKEYSLGPSGWLRDAKTNADEIPELMGRLCYGSFGERQGRLGAEAYLANILEGGHGSVLEHAVWGFVVVGASRTFTHQMVRHRAGWAFSQESQHFIKYATEGEPGAPEAGICVTGIPEELKQDAIASMFRAVTDYANLWARMRALFPSDAKVKKLVSGSSRGLLPGGLESRLGMTGNARALRHFCELRGTHDNTLEVRLVACQVVNIMKNEAPAIFQDIELMSDDDGYPRVFSQHPKV